ncbi:glycosyltransferase family 2 protein [Candidatus Omnitrophota bacterium]
MGISTKPLVSVLIAARNYGMFIADAIESVLGQTFPLDKIEIIVVDDGSEDNTREVVSKYADRVQYIYQENSGQAIAIKTGIDAARGKYLFKLDADDLFLPEKIEKVVNIFENDSDIVHVGTPVIYWDMAKGSKIPETLPRNMRGRKNSGPELLSFFCRRGRIFGGGSAFCARTDALRKIRITKKINLSIDIYLLLVTLKSGFSFYTEMPLSLYRIHGKNYSRRDINTRAENEMWQAEAISSLILFDGFPADVAVFYEISARVTRAKYKETIRENSFPEVVDMWKFILGNWRVFGKDILRVIWKSWVLNRTLLSLVPKFTRRC